MTSTHIAIVAALMAGAAFPPLAIFTMPLAYFAMKRLCDEDAPN
jgi:hypothetical protein